MSSLKIKQKYLFLAVVILLFGVGFGLYWKGFVSIFRTSFTLPQLAAPPKTYVFIDSRNGEIPEQYTDYQAILPKYMAYLNKASTKDKNMIQYLVGHLHYDLHNMEKAKEVLLPLLACDDPEMVIQVGEALAAIAYQNNQFAELQTMVNKIAERYPDQNMSILQAWNANALAKSGSPDAAFQLYDTLLQVETDTELRKELIERKQNLTWQLKKGHGVIEGYVEMVAGHQLPDIPVYLTNTAGANTVTPTADLPMTYTDEEGYYRFTGLPAGTYNVAIELRQDQFSGNVTTNSRGRLVTISNAVRSANVSFKIHSQVTLISPKPGESIGKDAHGKVDFEWKPLEGAAYYIFSIASYYDTPDSIQASVYANKGVWNIYNPKGLIPIYDTKVEIDLYSPFEYISRQEFPGGCIVPSYVLSWTFPGSKILWRVQAYDEDGNLIGDSNNQIDPTYKPYIVYTAGELGPGDQELLDGKYEAALEIYLREIQLHPDDKTLQTKIRDLVTGLKNFYVTSSSRVIDVLQRVHKEQQIPEDILSYILTKFETMPLWEMAVQGFVLGTEKPEVPLSWKLYFEPVIAELDQEELAEIRIQILERSFTASLEKMEDASFTRLVMGLNYKWLTDQSFRDFRSDEYKAYAEAVLAKSGKWHENMQKFLKNLSARKENFATGTIPK